MQELSSEVEKSIHEIVNVAELVHHYVSVVASAIEEQNAVTRDISANTQSANSDVAEISERIRTLTQ